MQPAPPEEMKSDHWNVISGSRFLGSLSSLLAPVSTSKIPRGVKMDLSHFFKIARDEFGVQIGKNIWFELAFLLHFYNGFVPINFKISDYNISSTWQLIYCFSYKTTLPSSNYEDLPSSGKIYSPTHLTDLYADEHFFRD
jgi:hypothetical protein